ncbi:MAG: ACT domain-containing protein [Proteobacteria bacterium]|jgi:hypothetical protein|nr:ACT domain-containing protein [Pseudomonadota bacterium]NLN62004.1 ACT domain-containing protein [Myxococcales bacterium]
MKLQQLSLFLENRPGQLSEACRILAENDINMLTLTLADTQQFGVLRVIVSDVQRARQTLEEAGIMVQIAEVIAVEVPNEPGGLARVLDPLEAHDLDIEYMYAFASRHKGRAVLVFRFRDTDAAVQVLKQLQLTVLREHQLTDLV